MKIAINSLAELIQRDLLEDYTGWFIETREGHGTSLVSRFSLLFAALKQHPKYASLDLKWVPEFIQGIPTDPAATVRDRRSARCVHFTVLEPIPFMIQAERLAAEKCYCRDQQRAANEVFTEDGLAAEAKTLYRISLLARNELLMKWILFLPMRQLNIRGLIIGKNLFRKPIPFGKDITIPDWAKEELRKNPAAEFWQFKFEPRNTKKENGVHCVLPQALIQPLEEYLSKYRPQLVLGSDPETLFLNENGKAMSACQMTSLIGNLTLRYAKSRITPHSFRHIAAYRWLELNPKDYATLSKMLWHASIDVTLQIYGEEFNESDGVCMWEKMLDKGATPRAA